MSIFKRSSPAQVATSKRDTVAELKSKEEAAELKLAELQHRRAALALAAVNAGPSSAEAKAYEQARKDEAAQSAVVEQFRDARAQAQKEAEEAERKSRAVEMLRRLDRTEKHWSEMRDNFGTLEASISKTVAAYQAVLREVRHLDFIGSAPPGCLTSAADVVRAVSHQLHKANGPTFGPGAMTPLPEARPPDFMTRDNPGAIKSLSQVVDEADRIIRERIRTEKEKLK